VSENDARQPHPTAKPDIILGDDWDERVREPDPDETRPKERRQFMSLNGSLARKIITFNLLALVVLVGGVLYLNHSRQGLVAQHKTALLTQARLIARVFETSLPAGDIVSLTGSGQPAPEKTLASLDLASDVEAFLFQPDGTIVGSVVGRPRTATQSSNRTRKVAHSAIVTDFLNLIWEQVANIFGPAGDARVVGVNDLANTLAHFGLDGETSSKMVSDTNGDLLFAVSTPIRHDGKVIGALVLTTVSGEISNIVRREREQVLQVFIVAILVSVALSLVLASTIANPLRELAVAADLGRYRNAKGKSQKRIRIPDMTGRPDEIGMLSGALRHMISMLYDQIDSNEQFAADVSHELKNPLASLRGAVETMGKAKNDIQREKLLSVIEHDVRRMDRLVSEISNASRLDSELVKDEMKSFDLVVALNNIVAFNQSKATEIGAELIIDLPQTPIIIQGLPDRLAQVFVNLLTNALSFCEDGDAVRLWARQREDRVLVVVEDTGPGIPQEALGKVFTRFYSDRPSNDYGNHSGLGLAISRQIVEAHRGVIWAENVRPTEADITSEPVGARFVVGLPV